MHVGFIGILYRMVDCTKCFAIFIEVFQTSVAKLGENFKSRLRTSKSGSRK